MSPRVGIVVNEKIDSETALERVKRTLAVPQPFAQLDVTAVELSQIGAQVMAELEIALDDEESSAA
jgi:hypothetical protein